MSKESITVADGKYTIINDNGKLSALRHGEPWRRDLTGDNLIYWMMVRIRELQDEVAQSKQAQEMNLAARAREANHHSSKEAIRSQERERCATIAWSHYMDTCRKQGISPANASQWLASTAIRSANKDAQDATKDNAEKTLVPGIGELVYSIPLMAHVSISGTAHVVAKNRDEALQAAYQMGADGKVKMTLLDEHRPSLQNYYCPDETAIEVVDAQSFAAHGEKVLAACGYEATPSPHDEFMWSWNGPYFDGDHNEAQPTKKEALAQAWQAAAWQTQHKLHIDKEGWSKLSFEEAAEKMIEAHSGESDAPTPRG